MTFEMRHEAFIQDHLRKRNGEPKRRLDEGYSHAQRLFLERVWWPAIGHFDNLHPEYEVYDFKDGVRYLDFAYFRSPFQLAIEIDGYGPHLRDASRWQFADDLLRQNHLIIDGWKILRFSYDDVRDKPRRCQQIIHQAFGRWFGMETASISLTAREKEVVRYAVRLQQPIKPNGIAKLLGVSMQVARVILHELTAKQVLVHESGERRVRSYRLNPNGETFYL